MVLRASSHSFKVCYNVPTCYDAWLIIYYLNLKHEQKLLDVNAIISHFYIILNSELQFCSKKKKQNHLFINIGTRQFLSTH